MPLSSVTVYCIATLLITVFLHISLRFGRDYYIKQASRSSGNRTTNMFEEGDDEIPETDLPTTEISTPNKQPTEIVDNPIKLISNEQETSGIFTAVPVSLEDHNESLNDDQLDVSSTMDISGPELVRPTALDISSDSDYSIERTYNVMTGEVSKKGMEVVEDAKSPVGIKYIQNGFDEDESVKNEFLKKCSAIKTLICDEVPSSAEQIKEVKEMLDQEDSTVTVPYEENNNIEHVNNNTQEVVTEDLLTSPDEPDKKDFSLEYSITDHGDSLEVDQPEIPEELLQSGCPIRSTKEPLLDAKPTEAIRTETIASQTGDSNEEMEIIIPSVKDLRKLFDAPVTMASIVTKTMSAGIKSDFIKVSEEPVNDIVIIENGTADEEVKDEEKPIFQSVKNLRKLFDKDNQQNIVNNSITARSISKQVQIQLKEDNTQY